MNEDRITAEITCQIACQGFVIPPEQSFQHWAQAALADDCQQASLCIRIVDQQESAELNQRYRGKAGATNVLAFSYEQSPLEGDLVICAPVVIAEAQQAMISAESHWAHMVIHGILHLRGYDHQKSEEAEQMEGQESEIMVQLGYEDPYTHEG